MEKKAWVAMGAVLLMAVPVSGLAEGKNDNNPFERVWDAIVSLEERVDSQGEEYVTKTQHEGDVALLQGKIDSLTCRLDGGEGCAGEDDDDGDDDGGGGSEEEYLHCGIGICRNAVRKYIDGVLQECVPGEPQMEVCDGLDNDCDGMSDEDFGNIGGYCEIYDETGTHTGTYICAGTGGSVCQIW